MVLGYILVISVRLDFWNDLDVRFSLKTITMYIWSFRNQPNVFSITYVGLNVSNTLDVRLSFPNTFKNYMIPNVGLHHVHLKKFPNNLDVRLEASMYV